METWEDVFISWRWFRLSSRCETRRRKTSIRAPHCSCAGQTARCEEPLLPIRRARVQPWGVNHWEFLSFKSNKKISFDFKTGVIRCSFRFGWGTRTWVLGSSATSTASLSCSPTRWINRFSTGREKNPAVERKSLQNCLNSETQDTIFNESH